MARSKILRPRPSAPSLSLSLVEGDVAGMGQALRRATGKLRTPPPSPPPPPAALRRPPPPPPQHDAPISVQDRLDVPASVDSSRIKDDLVVDEERDPGYDAMLSKMVGRITSKPGGKLEMGEAFIVDKYNRPMPKLRSSKAETADSKQDSVPPGTLTVVQLQQIIRLHHGKSDEHRAPMEIADIAKRFNIDAAQVKKIVQFVSLLPEEHNKNNQK